MTSPIDLAHRSRERVRGRRRVWLRRLVLVVVALAVVAVGLVGLAQSPVFSVRTVAVSGNKTVPAGQIRQAAAVPLNVPLARVDTAAIAQRVSVIPGVGSVDVRVELPDTVSIAVSERVVAFVTNQNKKFQWVDPSGQVFNETAQRPGGSVLGQLSGNDGQLRADVATVAQALSPKLRGQTKQITASGPDSIEIALTSGSKIVWGSADSSPLKGQVADALVNTKASVYDVSAPANPTTRQ
ncbi:FtsQ-type POTRA domain-containing protein [Nigerium sp.]|uniref:cell division protein FtsQ/DivIB n=1 Tax=Nigerium sp. TaxID=2042655 RepID=UPI0032215B02